MRRALKEAYYKYNSKEEGDEFEMQSGFPLELPSGQMIGIYPFYGKNTQAELDRVLKPGRGVQRMIVFASNMAETGHTIPDVRYVIDTGLDRHVSWNPETKIEEMRTDYISKAAMRQRAGRAGRVASGAYTPIHALNCSRMNYTLPCIMQGYVCDCTPRRQLRDSKMKQRRR
jgi:HrpA-like RNA helicase